MNFRGGCMHNEVVEKMYAQQWQTVHPQVRNDTSMCPRMWL